MAMNRETVYIKGDRNAEVTNPDVKLGDILSIECGNKDIIPRIKALKLLKVTKQGEQRFVISILRIIEIIHEQYPTLEIQNMGETDLIVTYEDQKTPNQLIHWLKTIGVILITFCGAAFSTMAFNNDVDTTKLFAKVYELVAGEPSNGFTILEMTYSIGLVIGILVFFNHVGRKRFTIDPTPMEVEMRLYENDIQTTLIENASREEREDDVGKTNHSGSSGA